MLHLSWKLCKLLLKFNVSLENNEWDCTSGTEEESCALLTHGSETHCDQKSMKFTPLVCLFPFIFPLATGGGKGKRAVGLLPGSCLKSKMTVIMGCCSFSFWKQQNGASEMSAAPCHGFNRTLWALTLIHRNYYSQIQYVTTIHTHSSENMTDVDPERQERGKDIELLWDTWICQIFVYNDRLISFLLTKLSTLICH